MQLNALNRLRVYIGNNDMEILINIFIYSNLNIAHYCGVLALVNQQQKLRKSTKVV